MLLAGAERRQAVVTDFGLARSSEPPDPDAATHTMTMHIQGTPGYMAPELLEGDTATVSSDVYALGVTAYRMVAGNLPTRPDVMAALDPKWRQAIQRALDRDPAKRFSSAGEFVDHLRGTGPVTVRELPVRNKWPLFVGAGLIALLLATWIGWRAWDRWHAKPSAEVMQLFRMGTDNIHAASYFAATKALEQTVRLAPQYSLAPLGACLAVERALPGQVADVGAGDERLRARARENRALDVALGRDALGGVREVEHHLIVQGVELFGTIDRDKGDAVPDVEQQGLVGHGRKLRAQ